MKNTYLMSSTTTVTFSSVVEAKDEMDAFEKMKKILTYRKGHIEEFDTATIDN